MVTKTTPRTDGMVLVMGVTGAGKSTFVNTLKSGSVKVSHGLEAAPTSTQAVQILLDEEQQLSVTVVDTPGFDDTWRSDEEILTEITKFMAAQYAVQIPLKGIIYLHPIYENRMKGSTRRNFEILHLLCGEHALKNVLLVTTRWDTVGKGPGQLGEALRREQELLDNWWKPMLRQGASATQFKGTKESAEAMVLELVRDRDDVVLDVQKELVDGDKEVAETRAGLSMIRQLENEIVEYKTRVESYDRELAEVRLQEMELRGQGARRDALKDLSNRIKELKEKKKGDEKRIKKLKDRQKKLKVKVGEEIRSDVESKKLALGVGFDPVAVGISVFVAVVNITLTVVKFVFF